MKVEIEVQLAIERALVQSNQLWQNLDRAQKTAAQISVAASNIKLPTVTGGGSSGGSGGGSAASNTNAMNALAAAIARQRATAATAAAATQSLNNAISASVAASNAASRAITTLATSQAQQAASARNGAAAQQAANTSTNTLLGGITRLAAGYLTLRAAWEFTADSVRQSIAVENLTNTLTATSGSAKQAASDIAFLRAEAQRIGISFIDSAEGFTKFSVAAQGAGLSGEFARETFTALSEASRRLGLNTGQQASVFLALEQMISKGVVSMQELRLQLGNALPGAFQIAARAMGITTQELSKLVETGNLASTNFLPKFIEQLGKDLPATAETLASTSAELSRLGNAWQDFKASIGSSLPVKGIAGAATAVLTELTPDKPGKLEQMHEDRRKVAEYLKANMPDLDPNLLGRPGMPGQSDILRTIQMEADAKNPPKLAARLAREGARISGGDVATDEDLARANKFWKQYRQLESETLDEEANKRQDIIDRYDELTQKIRANKDGFTQPMIDALVTSSDEAQANQLKIFDEKQWQQSLEEADKDWQLFLQNVRAEQKLLREEERNQTTPLETNFGGLNAERKSLLAGLADETTVEGFEEKTRRIQDINRAMYEQLRANHVGYVESFKFGIESVVESWGSASERMVSVGATLADSLQSNISGALTDIVFATESPKEAFAAMSRAIVQDLARVAIQQLLVKSILSGFGMGGSVPTGHAGMIVGREGSSSQLAPRFHSGGAVADEQLVMARQGEVIFTPEQTKMLGGRGGSSKPMTIINVFSQKVADQMRAANPDAVVNEISQNKTLIRQILQQ